MLQLRYVHICCLSEVRYQLSNKDIRIKLDGEYGNAGRVVTADGDIQGYIKNADEVIITESEYDFELIKIGEQSFYDTLIKKLS